MYSPKITSQDCSIIFDLSLLKIDKYAITVHKRIRERFN